ncbi:SRPBCC family protein [Nocardioides sp.]|uniref:SRPBCC family protein n=1 Tax=Nocardioides sp. TaxID=35761 RepID=UPI0027270F0F|nr:SRPBCC family protein [Nocardioides sp.]MDO9454665.1 SRPBCC family protein [Nocardioides sp.]
MGTYVITSLVTVDRPADEVAAYLLDWTHDVEWRAAVTRFTVEPTGRAVRGQRLVEELRYAGLTFRTPTTVAEVSPLTARYTGGGRSMRVAGVRSVVALGPDRCEVRTRTELGPRGAMRLLAPLLVGSYRRADAADLRTLAARFAGATSARTS